MARTRTPRRRRNAKQGRNVRVHLRKLQQAVNGAVIPITPLSDPPRINATRIIPIVTSCDVLMANTATALAKNGNGTSLLSLKIESGNLQKHSFTLTQLFSMYGTALNMTVPTSFQLALHKVSFWGPLPNQAQTSVALSINYGTIYRQMVQDQGTASNRPRVGVSLPQTHWVNSADTSVISFEVLYGSGAAPAPGNMLGVLHLSMSMRPSF